jgi:hypothetical protein
MSTTAVRGLSRFRSEYDGGERCQLVLLTRSDAMRTLGSMGRLPGAIDDGLVYHALNRGNNRADVYGDDADRLAFPDALAKSRERHPFQLFDVAFRTMRSRFS